MSRAARITREAVAAVRAGGGRTAVLAGGVAVGVAALSAVLMTAAGTRDAIDALVQKHGLDMIMIRAGGEVQVFAPTADRGLSSLFVEDAEAIERTIPGVIMVSPVQNRRGNEVTFQDRTLTTRAFGVDSDWIHIRRWGVGEGEFLDPDDIAGMRRVVLLGVQVARGLFPDGGAVGSTIRINGDPYVVKGVFIPMGVDAGGDNWDDRVVVPYTTSMRRLFNRPYLEQVVMRVNDPRRVPETAERIRELLRVQHAIAPGAPDNFFVREPEDVNAAALSATRTVSWLFYALAAVALLASGALVTQLMLAAVTRRTREIGIRRAVGARSGDIERQFLTEAMIASLLGGAGGLVLGIGIAVALAATGVAPSRLGWTPIVGALAACVAIGVVFGALPARRAARLDPVAALRHSPR